MSENGISSTHMDFKSDHDIEGELLRNTVYGVDVDTIDPINAFHFSGCLRALRKKEAEHCIDTAIYFQAMMEANINDALGSSANGSFRDKWKNFLKGNNGGSKELEYFNNYCENIYKKIRIPTVHAPNRKGLVNIEALRFSYVHTNIRGGWYCFVFLLNKVNNYTIDYEKNWKEMCEQIHRIPSDLDEGDYPDLSSIAGLLSKKHLDHINK
ncbi:MAG: hypothetical protein VW455_06535 [Nitrospinota bacterium]